MTEAINSAARKEFFQASLDRIREMRANVDSLAEKAAKVGVPESAFDEWRSVLNRQESYFEEMARNA